MAHPTPKKLSGFDPFGQFKTLFMTVAAHQAVLVTRQGSKCRQRTLKIADEHAALDWCLVNNAAFVLAPCSPAAAALN
jgi:hypothetical protein